ncbi:hypothetical protein ASPBRDRAFT_340711 [Aspergillus brasiliensis CBS 101740]|uniref:Uncharacterized protein n=1 Tax=Aspergillus brasiliensis (strain CBS 101740 / IMI 381727 / IBT 21946) TaxID=767769 RepID=A0A1L9U6R7_ASPBC|nr:hypothetical protein ASPBRDRAFT_340711 [Aspergillus brasiliensis CBS 101740]
MAAASSWGEFERICHRSGRPICIANQRKGKERERGREKLAAQGGGGKIAGRRSAVVKKGWCGKEVEVVNHQREKTVIQKYRQGRQLKTVTSPGARSMERVMGEGREAALRIRGRPWRTSQGRAGQVRGPSKPQPPPQTNWLPSWFSSRGAGQGTFERWKSQ